MRTLSFLPLLGLALTTAIAQTPVPTRAKTTLDGPATGYPDPVTVTLGIDASGPAGSMLRMTGGLSGALAALALGTQTTMVRMPQGTLLLVDPLVVIPGVFDTQGSFQMPFDILEPAFVGVSFHSQGLHYLRGPASPPADYFQMTPRLTVTVVAGNEQPPLTYDGPPLTATLLTKRVLDLAATHEVFGSLRVPTSGYVLETMGWNHVPGATRVWLVLEAPAADEVVMPRIEDKLVLADLGTKAEDTIEVWIEQRRRGGADVPVFLLAAVIERDF
jgi:hypothetical protein